MMHKVKLVYMDDAICLEVFTEMLNSVLSRGEFSENWRTSKTAMISKYGISKVEDYRTITFSIISYDSDESGEGETSGIHE